MRRQPYTECRIYYDGCAKVGVGDYLRTPAGSGYFVTATRQDRRRPYRVHLTCLRWPVGEIPADATVYPLHWYPRKRSQARRLSDVKP